MNDRQNGAVVIVTGASRGVGLAAARVLAGEGYRLVLAVRSAASAGALRQEFAEAAVVEADVASPDAAAVVLQAGVDRWGRVDGLVNNAGVIEPIGPLAQTDPLAWEQSIRTNLLAPYAFTRALLSIKPDGSRRRIVNVTSGAALQALEGWSAYCAGKAGLAMLTRSVHLEYGAEAAAFSFLPGLVDTDMQATIRSSGVNRVSQLPRSALRPVEEPARAVAYLMSGAADDLAGGDVDIREPMFRERVGLPAI
ncbi:MAG: SDR family NAD(P)-dependent oxidoreductase [Rhizobiaceae bacterium]|nr:SDR family NAD(P)-dependent oxidoreductase [Rhizobiaceae bacterium]